MKKTLVNVTTTNQAIRSLTGAFLMRKVIEARALGVKSFTLPELLSPVWPHECMMFYGIYNNEKTAGCEMGKLLGQVGKTLGLKSQKEDRRGKVDAITRYFV